MYLAFFLKIPQKTTKSPVKDFIFVVVENYPLFFISKS